MSGEFEITVDAERDYVRIRMRGFFTTDDIERFLEARRDAHSQLRCGSNQHVTMNDLREMKIQSQEIVDEFRRLLADPAYRSRRLAFVVSPTLARTQLMRAIAERHAQLFEDPWKAEAWLFHAQDARAA